MKMRFATAALLTAGLLTMGISAEAQTTMSVGDMAIIGVNGDNPDEIYWVPLIDLQAGTQVYFTDSGWLGDNSGFRANEGAILFTASAAITAGTVQTFTSPPSGEYATANDANVGTNGVAISTGGDEVLAFQGTTASPTFLHAVDLEDSFDSDATSSTETAVPLGLTENTSAVAIASGSTDDNSEYTGIRSGTPAAIFAAINNSANWTANNSAIVLNSAPFTIGGGVNTPPAVTNRTQSTDIPTSADTITITADITDSDGTIASANVFASINGGGFSSTAMVLDSGDTYTVDLGPFANTDTVEYYIEATDDDTDTTSLGDAGNSFFLYVNDNRPAVGEVAITEIMFGPNTDAPYSQVDAEFVEVLNLTGTPKDISFFLVDDSNLRNVAAPAGTTIPANGYAVFANSASDYGTFPAWTTSSGAAPVVDFDFGLGGGGDSFVIKNDAGTEIDRVDYENDANGWPNVDDTGSSIILIGDASIVDNNVASNWAASGLNGTPGAANVADVTAPLATSTARVDANPTTASTVDFTVKFDEAVKNVDPTDFQLTTTGTVVGTVSTVVIVDPSTFTVTVNTISGSGDLGLEFTGAQDIVDFPNNAFLGATPTVNEAYTVNPSSVHDWKDLD